MKRNVRPFQPVYNPPAEKPLSEALSRIIDRLGVGKKQPLIKIRAKWALVAGEDIAAHTRITAYRQKVLYVTVDSSALLQELSSFRKNELARRMAEGKQIFFVSEIRFKLGKVE